MSSTDNRRVIYLDLLRIVSMIAVVVLHTASARQIYVDVYSLAWNSFNIYNGIVRWAVPVFVMISGALFLNPLREVTVKQILTKNLLRIVTVYIFWSVLNAFIDSLMYSGSFFDYLISGRYHMWFLLMIAGLYLVVPLLRKITVDNVITRYFLILSFVMAILLPAVGALLKPLNIGLVNSISEVFGRMNFLGYVFYFVLGYYLSSVDIPKKSMGICYILGVFGFISTVLLTLLSSFYSGETNEFFYGYLTVNVMLESVLVFVLFKNKIQVKNDKAKKVIMYLSKLSLGVYMTHVFFLELFIKLGLDTLSMNPVISVPCISILAVLMSLLVSALLNKVPVVNKYFI